MNFINLLKCDYITPNKTVETVSIIGNESEAIFFIYNYKGVSFRLFFTREKLNDYWKGESTEDQHFITEDELDAFLMNYEV